MTNQQFGLTQEYTNTQYAPLPALMAYYETEKVLKSLRSITSGSTAKSHLNHKGHKEHKDLQEKHPRSSAFIRG